MQTFTGYQYLQIDIANCYGLDKQNWQDRLDWVAGHEDQLEALDGQADSPVLYRKALRAYRQAQAGQPVRHVVGLDATASGLQMLAVLTGCLDTAKAVNVISTGQREDVYSQVAAAMSEIVGDTVDRALIKKPLMTHYYQSSMVPKRTLGVGKLLKAFYKALDSKMPGAEEFLGITQSYWNPQATHYHWVMPDGHTVLVPVLEVEQKRIEVPQLNNFKFTYQTTVVKPKQKGRSLAANIVHSVDAYVMREMVKMAHRQGFELLPIHDCYFAHPNYLNQVRENYNKVLKAISDMDLLKDIYTQIGHAPSDYQKKGTLGKEILQADYSLS